jgi:hypothetical protein
MADTMDEKVCIDASLMSGGSPIDGCISQVAPLKTTSLNPCADSEPPELLSDTAGSLDDEFHLTRTATSDFSLGLSSCLTKNGSTLL